MEESDHAICQLRSAGYEGEQVLLLLVRLYFMLEENNEYRHLILTLAVSTAAWVAQILYASDACLESESS